MSKKKKETLIVGLTGQTGAGKSTVTESFAQKGFVIIDCDAVTRTVQAKPAVLSMLRDAYGEQILLEDGSLNRRMLAAIAFSEPKQTEKLGKLMFPPIKEEIERLIREAEASGKNAVLLDAPTLFESGLDKICRRRISVLADQEVRLQRILARDGITEEEARRRMSAQHPDAFYTVRSDFVLRNNGTKEELQRDGLALAGELTRTEKRDGKTALVTFFSIVLVIGVIMGVYQLTYRRIYARRYPETAASFSETTGISQSLLYALSYADRESDADTYAARLDELRAFPEADSETLAAVYYIGADTVQEWLADSDCSPDGVSLSVIPDEDAADFAERVTAAERIYQNLYE